MTIFRSREILRFDLVEFLLQLSVFLPYPFHFFQQARAVVQMVHQQVALAELFVEIDQLVLPVEIGEVLLSRLCCRLIQLWWFISFDGSKNRASLSAFLDAVSFRASAILSFASPSYFLIISVIKAMRSPWIKKTAVAL